MVSYHDGMELGLPAPMPVLPSAPSTQASASSRNAGASTCRIGFVQVVGVRMTYKAVCLLVGRILESQGILPTAWWCIVVAAFEDAAVLVSIGAFTVGGA